MPHKPDQERTPMSTQATLFPSIDLSNFVFEAAKPEGFWNGQLAARAKSVLPIFGGTSPDPGTASPSAPAGTPSTTTSTPGATTPAGGDAPTPEQVADLMKQVADLTKNVADVTAENATFKKAQEEAEKKTRTNEENLTKELTEAQDVIAKMDAVIKHTALVNAIQGFEGNQWHSVAGVMAELQDGEYDIVVDLDNGAATVTGIEKALQRVAKDAHWLVKNDTTQGNPTTTPPSKPSSGNPPAPPAPAGSPAERRASLINRFPVIGAGRAKIS